jgi:hypothetical protein
MFYALCVDRGDQWSAAAFVFGVGLQFSEWQTEISNWSSGLRNAEDWF